MIRASLAALALLVSAGSLQAAEPIVGKWKTANGETTDIASCGGAYCITVKTGKFAGKRIGRLAGTGGAYTGEITDPSNDKTYSGSAAVSGASLQLKGCVAKIFCRTQTWSKQ